MAVIEIRRTIELTHMIQPEPLYGTGFNGEKDNHTFIISCTRNGTRETLAGSVMGYVIRSDGYTVTVPGSISSGNAVLTLNANCYRTPGRFSVVIMLAAGTASTAIYAAVGTITRSTTDAIVDPEHVIPSIEELLAQIETMRAATAAAVTATAAANTATSAANTAASNADTKAGLANTAAATANTAASNADAKATLANTAAGTANTAAANADSKASAANTAAGSANTAATNANTKAGLADTAATAANAAAAHAEAAADFIDDMTAAATTLPAGSSATAELDRTNDVLRIGVPVGPVASIQSQATAYQNSSSGSVVPTGTWLDTQPVTPQGDFLWVRTTLTWSGGSATVIYTVSRMGVDGSGSVVSVNGIAPDAQGNVDIPEITTAQLQAICT